MYGVLRVCARPHGWRSRGVFDRSVAQGCLLWQMTRPRPLPFFTTKYCWRALLLLR